ncbi:hypothetical protein M407DRAFT_29487 [Tulasnella calospora MUT 4182]|uniref:Protein kinase domain-containing protein n=1 Tax=Tulasnella calospora MUT 4182 TaxID=1051891 RepID=A0A0C3KHE4_9AGAM|nr:hypothetical protein M407DRAFT_29487 [Tulasnella calospora MUT 4182]
MAFVTGRPSTDLNQIRGKLRSVQHFAGGGFSEVWRGEWHRPGDGSIQVVAIKYLKPVGTGSSTSSEAAKERVLKRLAREALILARTPPHPNIVQFYGYRERGDKNFPCIVTQYLPKGNLEAYLSSHQDLGREARVSLAVQCTDGLAHLHGLAPPIIHGDLKPQNVLLNDDDQLCLCDFGLAMVDGKPYKDLETTGIRGGTKGYDALELINGEPVTLATDIFAFGGLILAIMSGEHPYYKQTETEYFRSLLADRPPQPEEHPNITANDPLWDTMNQCWNKEPSARPDIQTVRELLLKQKKNVE